MPSKSIDIPCRRMIDFGMMHRPSLLLAFQVFFFPAVPLFAQGSVSVDPESTPSPVGSVSTGISASVVTSATPYVPEKTPEMIPGSEPFVFRKTPQVDLRLHVVKPKGWSASAKLPCMISYFGGGWTGGTPERSIEWARWAAQHGMVGVAPDYRTRGRFNTKPEECVSDGRAAVRWVQEHAGELGVDPSLIVCAGGSAGGHVAAWTAIPGKGPGADDPGAPEPRPAALVLFNPVTDTKEGSGYGQAKRFDGSVDRALACSVPYRMPEKMPPTIAFHATADTTVPYANSVAFREKMLRNGNRCELVTFEGLGHSYYSTKFGAAGAAAKVTTQQEVEKFLADLGLIKASSPAVSSTASPVLSRP